MTNHETATRKQLIEAMSAVSEDRTCCGWASDWARTLHAEGGIWETLGRAVGWPTGNYDAWVWVSWEEAARLYGHETSAAVSVPPPAPQAADRRARYAAAIAEGFRAFDADTTSDAYLDAVIAAADAEEAVTRADALAAAYRLAADAIEGMTGYPRLVLPEEIVAGLRRLAAVSGPVAGEQQNETPRRSRTARFLDALTHSGPGYDLTPAETPEARRCACPHPADEHSVYGCVDGCGCEWMPKRAAKGA